MPTRDARYNILFEPVKIGPVTAPNRFYQVPHCNGTSDWAPEAVARMREVKVEGGWGVVCTEIIEVCNNTELHPFPGLHLWRDEDIAVQAPMVEAVHKHPSTESVIVKRRALLPSPCTAVIDMQESWIRRAKSTFATSQK